MAIMILADWIAPVICNNSLLEVQGSILVWRLFGSVLVFERHDPAQADEGAA
jgi:hypothetical protein